MAVEGSILGNAVLRREDNSLLQGIDKYTDDLDITGVGHVHFVRSTIAAGTITSIDIDDAQRAPGVIAVFTADSLSIPSFAGFPLIPDTLGRPPLAVGQVRFVGDIVAAVVAETAEQAAEIGKHAEAIAVGSAFVNKVAENLNEDGTAKDSCADAVLDLVREISSGLT